MSELFKSISILCENFEPQGSGNTIWPIVPRIISKCSLNESPGVTLRLI